MSESITTANALYRSRNYQEALSIYQKIATRPEWAKLVRVNIALCRKRLDLPIKLSIVVPVYNTGQYLEQCLLSILTQTEFSLEVIVINDGSSDNSLEIIEQTMKLDERVVLINNSTPSGNPGTPRNQGIAIARGEYLGFVDSDDWVDPDYFAQLLAVIEKDNLDVAFASGYINHLHGERRAVSYSGARHFSVADSELHGYHQSFMIWDKVYRTSLIKSHSIKLGETKAAVDVPFIFKAYYLLKKAGFADTKGYNYRRESDSSVTVKFRKASNCDFEIQAYKDVEDWCRDSRVTEQYQNLVRYRKVSSYIYTLSVISPDEFHAFFKKIQPDLKEIKSDLIAGISHQLKRPIVFEQFKAITTGDVDNYYKMYRTDLQKNVSRIILKPQSTRNEALKPAPALPTFSLNGDRKGVLFFPDWSRSNPYQKLFYSSLVQNYGIRVNGYKPEHFIKEVMDENREGFAYIHLHWLHALMNCNSDDGSDNLLENLRYAKSLGYRIIYTAHNILSHEGEFVERELRFRRKMATIFDHVLVHGEFAKKRIINEIGVDECKIHVMPHGTYQGYYPNYVTREAAREKFGIRQDSFVFLFFGNIKGYKGVDALLAAYNILKSKRQNTSLLIAGRVLDEESKSQILDSANSDPSILLNLNFIKDEDVQYYFNAADLVILPYKSILTSGAALLSVTFERPIIAPRRGLIPELIQGEKQGYLFEDYDEMLALMEQAVDQQRHDAKAWGAKFEFAELNDSLRWPLLTAHPTFSEIFCAT